MKINFTKMHGIGNDYIYVDCRNGLDFDPCKLSILMSPRHFSVGADGLVLICESDVADAKMRMFNADGSEGKMCGNAIRCVGKFLYDNGIVKKDEISIETLSGIKYLKLKAENGKVRYVTVDMGFADFTPEKIPVINNEPMIDKPVTVNTPSGVYNVKLTAVSMGNPHAVCYVDSIEDIDLQKIGPSFENLSIFPERVNTEFVKVENETTLSMRVWERGSGETFACGTGACAVVASSVKNGICRPDTDVTVKLIGGELIINCSSDMRITMTGKAEKAYEGVYECED